MSSLYHAHERNDRRFCLTDFEACIAELLQGIVSDVPQTLDAFRFGLDDVKRLAVQPVAAGVLLARNI